MGAKCDVTLKRAAATPLVSITQYSLSMISSLTASLQLLSLLSLTVVTIYFFCVWRDWVNCTTLLKFRNLVFDHARGQKREVALFALKWDLIEGVYVQSKKQSHVISRCKYTQKHIGGNKLQNNRSSHFIYCKHHNFLCTLRWNCSLFPINRNICFHNRPPSGWWSADPAAEGVHWTVIHPVQQDINNIQ